MGHHGRVLKNFLEDESWRVPTIVVPPGGPASPGRAEQRLVSSLDIPATICDYAGAPALPRADIGRTLRPLLEGEQTEWRRHVCGETDHSAGVRDERFKAIFYPEAATRMFDLVADPLEMKNLAADPDYAEVRSRLEEQLREHVRSREIYAGLGRGAAGKDRSGDARAPRLAQARAWYESIIAGEGLAG
jgi:arylsulfatase A-like enzyme